MTEKTFEALEFGICLGFRISNLGFILLWELQFLTNFQVVGWLNFIERR
jgi:hypothetical protein